MATYNNQLQAQQKPKFSVAITTNDKETTFDWSRSYTRFMYVDAARLGMRTEAARAAADDSSIAKD